jgi:hypothetical protein
MQKIVIAIHQSICRSAIEDKVGNCSEFTHVVSQSLMNMKIDVSIEPYKITNGDHW